MWVGLVSIEVSWKKQCSGILVTFICTNPFFLFWGNVFNIKLVMFLYLLHVLFWRLFETWYNIEHTFCELNTVGVFRKKIWHSTYIKFVFLPQLCSLFLLCLKCCNVFHMLYIPVVKLWFYVIFKCWTNFLYIIRQWHRCTYTLPMVHCNK